MNILHQSLLGITCNLADSGLLGNWLFNWRLH